MRRVELEGPRRLRVVDAELPIPGPGEVRVKVAAAGLCGSDRRIYRGEYRGVPFPIVPGHEFSGVVDALGEGTDGVEPGDAVVIYPAIYCRMCRACQDNQENYCERVRSYGLHEPGGLSQYAVVRLENLVAVGSLPLHQAALAEPLACCLHGLDRVGLRRGESVMVLGAGTIGLLCAQLALQGGAASVLVADRNPAKLRIARSFGAGTVLLSDLNQVEGQPLGTGTGERVAPVDVAVEATGVVQGIQVALEHCRRGGRVLLMGVYDQDAILGIRPYTVYRNEISLVGSFAQRYDIGRAIRIMQTGRLVLEPLITHRFLLTGEGIRDAFETLDRPGPKIKVMVFPSAETG